MSRSHYLIFVVTIVLVMVAGSNLGHAMENGQMQMRTLSKIQPGTPPQLGLESATGVPAVVDAAIIQPYRAATIGTEVSGIIEAFNFEEGDLVKEGQVVAEISKKRYTANMEKAKDRVKSLDLALKRAKREAQVKEQLLAKGATTTQETLRAKAQVEISETEIQEARQVLKLAQLDLKSCEVKAPFTGYINVRHKHEHESIERLQPLFELVDSEKVYAVANVPEGALGLFAKGRPAFFSARSGKRYKGSVSKATKAIDPKSRTRKVYVLIANDKSELELGTSGALEAAK
jgi:RND family efflux transporter MFP subunit